VAIRTTDAAVKLIIEVDPLISTTPFIEVASSLVDEVVVDASYAAAREELIERWLSAHFYAIRDMRSASEKAGPVAQSFQFKVGLNLANTMYGQQAMALDTFGGLAAISKKAELGGPAGAGAVWLGTGDSDGNDTST